MLTSMQLINALAELFEATPEETNEALIAAGYDPDEGGERMAAAVKEAERRVRIKRAQATGEAEQLGFDNLSDS